MIPPGDLAIQSVTAEETRKIRHAVLRTGLPFEATVFAGDDHPNAIHLGAYQGDDLLGVASVLPEPCPSDGAPGDMRLRGMAIVEEARSRGIGSALLRRCIDEATRRGATLFWCHGRVSARKFYERHGLHAVGEPFESPNTGPHYLFAMKLAPGRAT